MLHLEYYHLDIASLWRCKDEIRFSNPMWTHVYFFCNIMCSGWCSLFNAELALSVTMTGLSTALSVFMLPVNLSIYVSSIYDGDVVESLNWFSLILSLVVVITGIASGVLCSAWQNSTRFNLRANQMGNMA